MAELWLVFSFVLLGASIDYNAQASANSGSSPALPLTISSTQSSGTLSTEVPPSVANNKSLVSSLRDFECPDGLKCRDLGASCIRCDFNDSCTYGQDVEVQCTPIDPVACTVSTHCAHRSMQQNVQIVLTYIYICNFYLTADMYCICLLGSTYFQKNF